MAPSLQQKLFVEFVGTAALCFTHAVYWAGPALGAVLGLTIFKAAYKGESKKKSKRKTR